MRRPPRRIEPTQDELRVNERIRISPIRVVDEDGEMLGIMTADEGRAAARERSLDLVEVSPNSRPPVCRVMDYGKFKYEQSKKERKARSRQHSQQLKEVKFRPKIEKHDLEVKVRNARRFLGENHKVKVTMNFRGREVTHAEIGRAILERVAGEVKDVGTVETAPRMEGRHMLMLMAPLPSAVRKKIEKDEREDEKGKQEQATAENTEGAAEAESAEE